MGDAQQACWLLSNVNQSSCNPEIGQHEPVKENRSGSETRLKCANRLFPHTEERIFITHYALIAFANALGS